MGSVSLRTTNRMAYIGSGRCQRQWAGYLRGFERRRDKCEVRGCERAIFEDDVLVRDQSVSEYGRGRGLLPGKRNGAHSRAAGTARASRRECDCEY